MVYNMKSEVEEETISFQSIGGLQEQMRELREVCDQYVVFWGIFHKICGGE